MIDPEIEAIDAAMKAATPPKSRADLGRLLGLDSSQTTRIFNGKRRLQLHERRKIDEWLGGSPVAQAAGGTILPMPNMVPLYGWVGAASENRLTMADQSLRGYVPIHPAQIHVRDPFALEVADVSMSPRYEPGEIVYLAPNRFPARGQDCVIVTKDSNGFLKRFVRRDADTLTAYQFNPAEELEFKLADIEAVHTVVGRN